MTKRIKKEKTIDHWLECGIPSVIADYIANWPDSPAGNAHPLIARARRFRTYWEQNPDTEKILFRNWRALGKNAVSDEKLLTLFLTLPDGLTSQPYENLFGKRKLKPKAEANLYKSMQDMVSEVIKFVSPHGPHLMNFYRDAQATGGQALTALSEFRLVDSRLVAALMRLNETLALIDPAAKYKVGQPDADDADKQIYIFGLASKNRHLTKPQHAALAYLGAVNFPDFPVSAAAVRMAWARNANTKQ